jgi:alpha-mannosidase
MPVNDIVVLIPSHSLEDFPSDQGEEPAAGLLNAFAVAWHPQLIAEAGQLPRWHRADEPPEPQSGQVFFAPDVCQGWLPCDWIERARTAGATVVADVHQRAEMEQAALAGLNPADLDRELVSDFHALGTSWILVELLTRQMRNFGNIDELRLQNRAVAGARAVMAHDQPTAEAHLQAAFEVLLEARERFYPVECYLLDLCLVIPDVVGEPLLSRLRSPLPVNLLIAGRDLERFAIDHADVAAALKSAVAEGRASVLGGELREGPLPLLPLESVLHGFHRGHAVFSQVLGARPRVWGRRRYGLSPALPQILGKFGYVGALHVVLDDGIYPDAEHSRLRWQGIDETLLDAFSRIPLAADGAPSYLRFPARMSESMDNDHVAAVTFARWPEVKTPWLGDLQRTQKYAPVLGKFITFEQLFAAAGSPGKLSAYQAKEYFTANLIQHVARREADPMSRYSAHTVRRRRFDAANWCRAATASMMGQSVQTEEESALEDAIESAGPVRAEDANLATAEDQLVLAEREWPERLAQVLVGQPAAEQRGMLVINPFSFPRRITLALPQLASPPQIAGAIKAVDFDPADAANRHVTLDLPGCGFAWVPTDEKAPLTSSKALACEPWLLRNERFEVTLNEETGGITQVRHPRRRENRFSQMLSYRFPRERSFVVEEDGERRTIKSLYAEPRCDGHEILSEEGAITSAVTWGRIVDQTNNEVLARFRQTVRLFRLRPVIEIDVELSDVKVIDGDPWNHYFCSRFAWDDSAATITRSQLDGAHGFAGERFESSEYIEFATFNERTTVVTHGLPFHRKSGSRMVDTLLVTAGETQRRFRFSIAIDHSYPLEAARDLTGPVYVVPTLGPPRSGTTGWLFHLDARNVQLQRILDVMDVPATTDDADAASRGPGFALRLVETEGRGRRVMLRCFRAPLYARKRDFLGQTLRELALEGDAVLIEMTAYEIAEIELRFAE